MNIRGMKPEDTEKIKEIHERFNPDLEFPDFLQGFYCGFTITDDKDEIVVAGGLRPSAEIILVVDKDKNEIAVGKALLEAQKASLFIGHRFGLDEIVAFVRDNDKFVLQLLKHGFHTRSSAFAIKVPK